MLSKAKHLGIKEILPCLPNRQGSAQDDKMTLIRLHNLFLVYQIAVLIQHTD
jgi:hypothetical protein